MHSWQLVELCDVGHNCLLLAQALSQFFCAFFQLHREFKVCFFKHLYFGNEDLKRKCLAKLLSKQSLLLVQRAEEVILLLDEKYFRARNVVFIHSRWPRRELAELH